MTRNFAIPYCLPGDGLSPVEEGGTGIGNCPILQSITCEWVKIDPEQHTGGYCCLVPVIDHWRLDPAVCRKQDVSFFVDLLSPQVVSDLHKGRCILVLDLSNEGPLYKDVHKLLTHIVELLPSPDHGIVFIQQNSNFPGNFEFASAGDSTVLQKIKFFNYNSFISRIAAALTQDAAAVGGSDCFPEIETYLKQKDRLMLCLNASPRVHRVITWLQFQDRGYQARSLMSFLGFDTGKGQNFKENFSRDLQKGGLSHLFDRFAGELSVAERVDSIESAHLDGEAPPGNFNELVTVIPVDAYRRTYFSVVTESDFIYDGIVRITEKTIKALAMGHPGIIIGNPNSLPLVEQLGFEVFDDVIKRDYDEITTPAERLEAIFNLIDETLEDVSSSPEDWGRRIYDRARFNFEYARTSFGERYRHLYSDPLVEYLAERVAE